jgi:hypothetical protein
MRATILAYLKYQHPTLARYRAATDSRSGTGAFYCSNRTNSRIQDGWSGQARADTIMVYVS